MANNKILSQLMLDSYRPQIERVGFQEAGFISYGKGQDIPNGLRIQAYIKETGPHKKVVTTTAGTDGLNDAATYSSYVVGGYHDQFGRR